MFFHVFHDKSPTPNLERLVEQQRQFGGRLVLYRRAWALILVAVTQDRVVWVPPGGSRHWAGWRQSLFTLLLGIWCIACFLLIPIILFSNFRGGIDVTEHFSNSAIDPLRESLPVTGTSARESRQAEWGLLAFLLTILLVTFSFVWYNYLR